MLSARITRELLSLRGFLILAVAYFALDLAVHVIR